jgi:hypothetical protein
VFIGDGDVVVGQVALALGAPPSAPDLDWVVLVERKSFVGTPSSLSLSKGGAQSFALDGGPGLAGRVYVVLGSLSGTQPGVAFSPGLVLPLNPDLYFDFLLNHPASGFFPGALGLLDASGRASASFGIPAQSNPVFTGLQLHHAWLAPLSFASEPVGLRFEP